MGLIDRFFGSNHTDGSDDERPPKPDDAGTNQTKEFELTRSEATVHYRNGESETFECYGIYTRNDTTVVFKTDPYPTRTHPSGTATYDYDLRRENYEVLSREPVLEEVATDTFVLEYSVDYKWDFNGYVPSGGKVWCERHVNMELTVERDTE